MIIDQEKVTNPDIFLVVLINRMFHMQVLFSSLSIPGNLH